MMSLSPMRLFPPIWSFLTLCLAETKYAVGVAKGNPDLLGFVNAMITSLPDPDDHRHRVTRPSSEFAAEDICELALSVILAKSCRTKRAKKKSTWLMLSVEGFLVAMMVSDFEKVTLDQRVSLLTSWSKILEPILKTISVLGSVLNSNWWHLGMAGKLPDFLCPKECVGQQDFVGLDYYWGIDSFEFDRMHQLIDASMSHFDSAPVDPPGLLRALTKFHRWFPGSRFDDHRKWMHRSRRWFHQDGVSP